MSRTDIKSREEQRLQKLIQRAAIRGLGHSLYLRVDSAHICRIYTYDFLEKKREKNVTKGQWASVTYGLL